MHVQFVSLAYLGGVGSDKMFDLVTPVNLQLYKINTWAKTRKSYYYNTHPNYFGLNTT